MIINELPHDFFLKIEDNENFVIRITLNLFNEKFYTEIDIVHHETKKIYKHIDDLYNFETADEAINVSVDHISKFIHSFEQ